MKRRISIIGLSFIVIIATFLYAHIDKMNPIYNQDIDTSQYMQLNGNEGKITQRFVSVEDKLDGISIKCQVAGSLQDVEIEYLLVDLSNDKIVAEGVEKGIDIENSKFHWFEFATVDGCLGKEFEFVLDCKNTTDINTVTFSYEGNTEKNTQLEAGDTTINGTLIFRTITQRFDFETFCILLVFILYIIVFLKFLYHLFK